MIIRNPLQINQEKLKKSKSNEHQLKGSEANLVDKFTKLIMEGPVNVCNCCLYARSVLRFHQNKYEKYMDRVFCNFTQQEHICRTCDRYLHKSKIPPQTVCSKLSIPIGLKVC